LLKGVTALGGLVSGDAVAEDGDWLRNGDLGERPKRQTDKLPLSDQQNAGGWTVDPRFTDEFEGTSLDLSKWYPTNPEWTGRPPSAFATNNVRVAGGELLLDLRKEKLTAELEHRGFGWTSGAVQSRARVRYGYFEVRSKPMKSPAASTFWFYAKGFDKWTEIDVYEVWPGAPGKERLCSTNLHVFDLPDGKPDHAYLGLWTAPFSLADDYHVYGLEWSPQFLLFFVDGVLIRRKINTAWHQDLSLNLDVEIMANLTGMPGERDGVIPYSIDYVRGFKKGG
jgi:beta-glucanase (GH16 family)